MPVHSAWLVPHHVLKVHLYGDITPHDLRSAPDIIHKTIGQGSAPIYLTVDASGLKSFPVGLSEYFEMWGNGISPNIHLIAIHSLHHPLAAMLARIFVHFTHGVTRIVENEAEALALIEHRRGKSFDNPRTAQAG